MMRVFVDAKTKKLVRFFRENIRPFRAMVAPHSSWVVTRVRQWSMADTQNQLVRYTVGGVIGQNKKSKHNFCDLKKKWQSVNEKRLEQSDVSLLFVRESISSLNAPDCPNLHKNTLSIFFQKFNDFNLVERVDLNVKFITSVADKIIRLAASQWKATGYKPGGVSPLFERVAYHIFSPSNVTLWKVGGPSLNQNEMRISMTSLPCGNAFTWGFF